MIPLVHTNFTLYRLHKIVTLLIAGLILPYITFSQKNITQLIASLEKAHDTNKAEAYYNIYNYYKFYQPDSAYYFLNEGVKKFTKNKNKAGVASLTQLLGVLDANHGNLTMARKRVLEALVIFKDLDNKRGIGLVFNTLGTIEGRKGNWDSAAVYFINAQKIFQVIKYDVGLSNTYTNLGLLYQNTGKNDKALLYYNKLLEIAIKDTNDIRAICNAYNNIAIVYGKQGGLDSAVYYLQRALSKSNKEQYIDIYLYSLLNMGIVHSKFNNNEKALSFLNDALKIAKEKRLVEEYANILVNIAPITALKDPKAAIIQLEDALQIALSMGDKLTTKDIYEQLSFLNKKIGNYKAVVALMELIKKYEDSTSNVEKAREIANLQSVYELEQSNEKIKELQYSEEVSNSKRNVLIVLLCTVGIVIILILLNLYKIKKLNSKLSFQKSIIESANNDLARLNILNQKIFYVISHDFHAPILTLNLLLKKLRKDSDPNMAKHLNEVENQFNNAQSVLMNLLNWSKAEMNIADGSLIQKADLKQTLNEITDQLSSISSSKQVTIKSDIEQVELNIPVDILRIVLRNLLFNAIKYSHNYSTVEVAFDPSSCQLSITDKGVGIEPDRIKELFTKNVVSTFGTNYEPGFGIGLYIVAEMLRKYNSIIRVESKLSQGTVFFIKFPR